jgi:hypothetical protein
MFIEVLSLVWDIDRTGRKGDMSSLGPVWTGPENFDITGI